MYKFNAAACLIVGSILTLPFSALANHEVRASKISCEDFLGLDETIKPKVVYFIEGVAKSGKTEVMEVTVDQIDKPVAFVIEECQKTPKATVWQKIKNYIAVNK